MYARMRTMLAWTYLSLAVLGIAFFPVRAFGLDPDLNATLAPGADGQSIILSTSVKIPTAHSSVAGGGSSSSYKNGPIVRTDVKQMLITVNSPSVEVSCDPETFNPDDYYLLSSLIPPGDGVLRHETLVNRVTGETISERYYCSDSSSASGASLSSGPTYADIWSTIFDDAFTDQANSSGVYVAPVSPGVTGLETRMWAQFPSGQTVARDVDLPDGYHVSARVHIKQVSILLKDTTVHTLATRSLQHNNEIDGGSYEHPMATYVFDQKGDYYLISAIEWEAEPARLTGPGISIDVPLGSLRIEINRAYHVNEINPALTE